MPKCILSLRRRRLVSSPSALSCPALPTCLIPADARPSAFWSGRTGRDARTQLDLQSAISSQVGRRAAADAAAVSNGLPRGGVDASREERRGESESISPCEEQAPHTPSRSRVHANQTDSELALPASRNATHRCASSAKPRTTQLQPARGPCAHVWDQQSSNTRRRSSAHEQTGRSARHSEPRASSRGRSKACATSARTDSNLSMRSRTLASYQGKALNPEFCLHAPLARRSDVAKALRALRAEARRCRT